MRNSFVIALLLASTSAIRLSKKADPQGIEGHVDMAFQPHPILPNTLHAHNLKQTPAVARNEHIGDSVWRSSVNGGEPIPEPRRDLTGHMNSMFNYPVEQTPSVGAGAKNGVAAPEVPAANVDKAAIAASLAKAAKEATAERAAEVAAEAPIKPRAGEAAGAKALVQKKNVEDPQGIEGHVDMAFQPHPILPNTLHKDQLTKIAAVSMNEHIGESVQRSAVLGGEPNPEPRRDLTGHLNSMFKYPTKQTPDPTADPTNHGMPAPEEESVVVDKAAVAKSQAAAAKVAEAEKKEEEKAAAPVAPKAGLPAELDPAAAKGSLAQKKDIEGHVDLNFQPHPILPNSVHVEAIKQMPSVALNGHIGESVQASSHEAGEPFPEQRRNLANPTTHMFTYEGHTPAPQGGLAQKKDIEGHSDPDFLPHPILPNTIHNSAVKQMPSVSRNEHIGDSVWRSAQDAGEPHPEKRRNITGANSFKYDGHTPAPAGGK